MATVTIELPDVIIKELETAPGAISHCVLEAVALEGYRSQKLSARRGQTTLGADLARDRSVLGSAWNGLSLYR